MALRLEPKAENPARTKLIFAIVAWVAAAMLLYCAVSRRWLAADHADAGFGPIGWSCSDCGGELEGAKSNGELVKVIRAYREEARRRGYPPDQIVKDPSDFFPISGYLAAAFIVIAAGGLIASGVFAIRQGIPIRPIAPTTIALLGLFLALIFGMVFVAQNPLRDKGMSPVGVSWGFWAFGIAVVGGIVAAQRLAKFKKPDPGDFLP